MQTCTQLLVRTSNVAIYRYRHPDPQAPPDGEELHTRYGVHLVDAGRLQVGFGREIVDLCPGAAFIGRPGDVHRYLHPGGSALDVCISVQYTWNSELDAGLNPLVAAKRFSTAPSNRLRYLRSRFASLQSAGDPFALEDWAVELSSAALAEIPGPRNYREASVKW
jgi:mannose-6-phosphate isomerase-like protein (cupin superfamily)